MKVIFHPAADAEMIAVARFYDSKVHQLGADFLDEIERYCHLLAQQPLIGNDYLHGTRRVLTQRFPYSIVYRIIEEQQIEIIAVAHQHRNPGYWKELR
jgi:toxin ParE1/3/4